MSPISVPAICLVTDRHQLCPDARTEASALRQLESWLDDAIDRVDLIQVRERDVEGRRLLALADRLARRTRGTRTRLVVNDRADVAVAAGLDGVHLRADGPAVSRVRSLGPHGWLVGRSVHGLDEVRAQSAADYLLFGTMFPTGSKPPGTPVQGADALSAAVRATSVPVVAIGGITAARARVCFETGAAGVAAIGLFLPEGQKPGALGVRRAVSELRAAFDLPPLA